jgi:hypothetical protein
MKVGAVPGWLVAVGVAAAAGAAFWLYSRGVAGIASAAVGAVADGAAGAVIGAGKVVGIPETEAGQCAADRAAGRTWDASFSCPAGDFLAHVFGGDD